MNQFTTTSSQFSIIDSLDARRSKKAKSLPYSLPSVGPAADPSVQAVSPQVTSSHPPGGRLPLLSTRPAVTFPAEERHHPSASTKLYCLVTVVHGCENLPKVVTRQHGGRGLNSRPLSHEPDVLATRQSSHPCSLK